MKLLDLFIPFVTYRVMGCPDPTALQAIRSTCIDFCRRTGIVERVLAGVDIVAAQEDYTVIVPTDMSLHRIVGVSWQGTWLTVVPPGDVRSAPALRGVTIGTSVPSSGTPQFYFQKTNEVAAISLYPIPDTALTGGLTIKASFKPLQTATTIDDQLFDEWCDGIAAGAVARLQAVPGLSFSSNSPAARTEYEMAVSAAKRQVLAGKNLNGLRVQPRSFT